MALAIDSVSTGSQESGPSFNWSHTCAVGATCLRVAVVVPADVNISVTYNGVSLTAHDSHQANEVKVAVFRLANPASGANSVVVNTDHNGVAAARAISVTGGDTSTPLKAASEASGTSNDASVTVVDSASGDIVVDDVVYLTGSTGTWTAGASQTAVTFVADGSFTVRLRGSYEAAAGASTVMSWSNDGAAAAWVSIGTAFKVAPEPGVHTKTGTGYLGFVGTGSDEVPRFGAGKGTAGFSASGGRLSVYGETGTGRMGMAAYGAKGGITHTKQNASSATLKLAWDASTSPNVLGYRVYWGTSQGSWPNMVDVGLVLTYILQGLPRGTIWLVVTAYNASGESTPSNEISAATAYGVVMTASALRQRDFIRQEIARIGFTASGAVVKPEKTGTGQLGFTASGADVMTFVEEGTGRSDGFTGSGVDAMTYVESGYAAAGFGASGVGETTGIPDAFLKTGGGSLGFAATGDWQAIWTEAGVGKLGLTATSSRSVISIPTTVGTAKKRKRSEGRSKILSLTEDR